MTQIQLATKKQSVKYIYADAKENSNSEIQPKTTELDNAEIKANSIAVLSNSQIAPNGKISFDRVINSPVERNNF